MQQYVFIALGANCSGPWGEPVQTLTNAIKVLQIRGLEPCFRSRFYLSEPLGSSAQSNYVNAVIKAETYLPPLALLRFLKMVERAAGRKGGRYWGPRALDLDIIDYKGRVLNWDKKAQAGKKVKTGGLILPHPHAHNRPFVLVPLQELSPNWRHPVFYKTASVLLGGIANTVKGQVIKPLDQPM